MGSSLLPAAEAVRVAAGGALAVDRDAFSARVTALVEAHPNITVRREEAVAIDEAEPVLIATGPLTEGVLADAIARLTGDSRLHFYDAVAPIVTAASLGLRQGVRGVPLRPGGGGLFELPLQQGRVRGVPCGPGGRRAGPPPRVRQGGPGRPRSRRRGKKADAVTVYEGCMPIEIMAARGADTMRYGPLRPVGLTDPRTGHRPWANVQLRAENRERRPVQHRRLPDQPQVGGAEKRVFSMIPGLEQAEFVRYGVMHRNTFLDAPRVLTSGLYLKAHPNVFFAGQITGFEGLYGERGLRPAGRPQPVCPPDRQALHAAPARHHVRGPDAVPDGRKPSIFSPWGPIWASCPRWPTGPGTSGCATWPRPSGRWPASSDAGRTEPGRLARQKGRGV